MAERELITAAFGNYGNLVAAQYINGTSRFDMEHSVLYFENSRGARMPRLVMLDHQHPSRIVAELDINKVVENRADNSTSGNGYSDPCARIADESEDAYAERMFLNDETLDENAFYGGAAIGERVKAARRREREAHKHEQHEPEDSKKDNDEGKDEEDEDEDDDTIPIFNVKDPLVPWYRFINPPLHRTAYSLMRSSHTDPRGTSLLHSFGHGLSACASYSSAPPELQHTWENLRYQLESADRCQGFQFFVDADGALGGYAHASIRHIHDEFDDEIPIATHALFLPFDIDMVEDDFAKQRQQELILNQALSTHYLSTDSSAIYVPYRIADWGNMWGCDYVNDNVATAQMVAAAVDSGFYATRDSENRLESTVDVGQGSKPLSAFADALKPAPSYRICSAFAALPFSVKPRGLKQTPPSFSELLQDHPLLPMAQADAASSSPEGLTYRPLTHTITKDPATDTGRVFGQTFTLRGVGGLLDRDYPRLEAISRFYLYPTRCSRVIATVTDVGYAISGTFSPAVLGFPAESDLSKLPHTPMAAHYCSTGNVTPMLKKLLADATPIIRYGINGASSPLRESYGLEKDEWTEVLESLHMLRDDYDHDDQREDEDED